MPPPAPSLLAAGLPPKDAPTAHPQTKPPDGGNDVIKGERQEAPNKGAGGPGAGAGGAQRKGRGKAQDARGGPMRSNSGKISVLVKDPTTGAVTQVLGEQQGGAGGGGGGSEQGPLVVMTGTLTDGFVSPQVRARLCVSVHARVFVCKYVHMCACASE